MSLKIIYGVRNMVYKNIIGRILMTSVVALSSLSAQYAIAMEDQDESAAPVSQKQIALPVDKFNQDFPERLYNDNPFGHFRQDVLPAPKQKVCIDELQSEKMYYDRYRESF